MFTKNEIQNFSLSRAIRDVANERYSGTLESEMLADAAQRANKPVSPAGFVVPWELLGRSMPTYSEDEAILERTRNRYHRTLDAASSGAPIVPSPMLAAVDALRGYSAITDLGASVVSARGKVAMPEASTPATVHWLPDEYTALTDTQPAYRTVSASPKIAGALIRYSKLWEAASMEGEAFVEEHLLRSLGAALDRVALNGSGAAGEPTGLAENTDVQAVSLAGDPAAAVAAALRKVEETGGRASGFALDPVLAESMRTTAKISGSAPILDSGQIHGKPAIVSTAVPASTAMTGEWRDLVIVLFGQGVELAIDPFTEWDRGILAMRALLSCDIAIRRADSFVKIA